MLFHHFMLVGLGGFLGAIARYAIVSCPLFATPRDSALPWGTLAVNIIGCLVLGLVLGILDRWDAAHHELRLFLIVGICGGFTTFSAFANELHHYLKTGNIFPFATYLLISCVGGLIALYLGNLITSPNTP